MIGWSVSDQAELILRWLFPDLNLIVKTNRLCEASSPYCSFGRVLIEPR